MGLARDYAPLPAWLLDADYGLDFAFYGASETDPVEWPEGSTFSLHLAPAGRAKPAADDVHELTTAGGGLVLAEHVVGIVSAAEDHADWSPGLYEVQLRRTGPEGATEALYFGQVWLARGLSQLAELGGGDSAGIAGGQGVKVFRDTGPVRVLRGESAATVALASSAAAAAAADRVAVAADRLQTGVDRAAAAEAAEATASDRVQTGEDRQQTASDRQATAADAEATGEDRVQTGQDRAAVAADRQSALEAADVAGSASAAALASATEAAGARDQLVDVLLARAAEVPLDVVEIDDTVYTLGPADDRKLLVFTASDDVFVYADAGAPEAWRAEILKAGAGDVRLRQGSAQIYAAESRRVVSGLYASASILGISPAAYLLRDGDASDPLPDWIATDQDRRLVLFHADFENDQYFHAGQVYADQAAFLAGVGGVVDGDALVFGPREVTGLNLITNTEFADTASWAARDGSSAIAAVTDGGLPALQITLSAAVFGGCYYQHAGDPAAAYRYDVETRRGTSPSAVTPSASASQPTLSGVNAAGNATTGWVVRTLYIPAIETGLVYVGTRVPATGIGTHLLRSPSLVEVSPYEGYQQGANTIVAEAVTAAAAVGDQVVWQDDGDSARDCIRILWSAAGRLRLQVTANNFAWLDADLGEVSPSTPFAVAAALAEDDVACSLNGKPVLTANNVTIPGAVKSRVGRSFTGEVWQGERKRVLRINGRQRNDWLRHVTASPTAAVLNGDSYAGGTVHGSFEAALATASGSEVIVIGVGGTVPSQQRDALQLRPYLRPRNYYGWDGGPAGLTIVDDYMEPQRETILWLGHDRFVLLPPIAPPPLVGAASPVQPAFILCAEIHAAMVSEWGEAHVLNPIPIFQELATASADDLADVAAGRAPRSIFPDGVHPTQAAFDHLAPSVAAKMAALEA